MSLKSKWQKVRFDRYTKDVHRDTPVEPASMEPAPVTPVSRAEEVPPQMMPKYRICERCLYSYVYNDVRNVDRLMCRFMNRPIVEVLEAGVHTCGMFEECLGCMHCKRREGEPVTLLNGDMYVKCRKRRPKYGGGEEVTLGWENVKKGTKCGCYCKKEDE